jgi:hypothetical protein
MTIKMEKNNVLLNFSTKSIENKENTKCISQEEYDWLDAIEYGTGDKIIKDDCSNEIRKYKPNEQ